MSSHVLQNAPVVSYNAYALAPYPLSVLRYVLAPYPRSVLRIRTGNIPPVSTGHSQISPALSPTVFPIFWRAVRGHGRSA
eukprot:674793-Rhodomonas_salina.3